MRHLPFLLPGLLPALLAAPGCSSDDPIAPIIDAPGAQPDGRQPDGPLPGDDGEQPGGPSGLPAAIRGSVVGKLYNHCPGNTERQTDLSTTAIEVLVPDGSGGYRAIAGVGRANGTFQIDGVPEGRYLLHLGGLSYIDTDQRVIDDFGRLPTRCAPAPLVTSVAGTTVAFDITGMTPVSAASRDSLEVISMALGYRVRPPVPANATSFTTPHPWVGSLASAPLPDASFGDDITVLHSQTQDIPDTTGLRVFTVTRLVDWFQTTATTVRSGDSTAVTGEFHVATSTRGATVVVDLASLEDGRGGIAPPAGPQVIIAAQPQRGSFLAGTPATLASLDLSDRSHTANRIQRVELTYPDPFPASWQRTATLQTSIGRSYRRPGQTDTSSVFALDYVTHPYTSGPLDFAPIAVPTSATIGGVDFFAGGSVPFDGQGAVHLTWSAVPEANYYRVAIARIPPPDQPAALRTTAVLFTEGTAIDIPAQLLRSGSFHVLTIQATSATADFAAGHITVLTVPGKGSTIASGRLRFDATCGDGVVQPDEECDDARETATCNADCTRPSCGDGVVNTSAGEACDAGANTPDCDSDCTLPRCGDGTVNGYREDCELDEPGCSADCHYTGG